MLVPFFFKLRAGGVPVTLTEFLLLLESLDAKLAESSAEKFYYLSRACLVKDERHYDRFDRVFAAHVKGIEDMFEVLVARLPEDWLKRLSERILSEEEKAQVEALGGWDKLMQTLKERLKEQKERHEGGNKWIGTGGTSPFGAYGYNPEGIRIGQDGSRNKRAVKVWDRREFRNLDDTIELGTRNIKVALRKLRKFAREGVADQLDLDDTISSTARNAGLLDLKFVPERHNAVKVLLFFDVGGSMDPYVRICEELFSAARSEFKHLKYYYFHNCIYESVWQDNRRRHSERIPTHEVLRTYGHDYKVIFVGDASMSPYEITQPGGSVEHWNDEAGIVWLQRVLKTWPHHVWLNPEPESRWSYTQSINMVRELVEDRMFPLTLQGLDRAIKALH
jgi:uncharacterized protein with von Willebrand factor type A (vWA) domain